MPDYESLDFWGQFLVAVDRTSSSIKFRVHDPKNGTYSNTIEVTLRNDDSTKNPHGEPVMAYDPDYHQIILTVPVEDWLLAGGQPTNRQAVFHLDQELQITSSSLTRLGQCPGLNWMPPDSQGSPIRPTYPQVPIDGMETYHNLNVSGGLITVSLSQASDFGSDDINTPRNHPYLSRYRPPTDLAPKGEWILLPQNPEPKVSGGSFVANGEKTFVLQAPIFGSAVTSPGFSGQIGLQMIATETFKTMTQDSNDRWDMFYICALNGLIPQKVSGILLDGKAGDDQPPDDSSWLYVFFISSSQELWSCMVPLHGSTSGQNYTPKLVAGSQNEVVVKNLEQVEPYHQAIHSYSIVQNDTTQWLWLWMSEGSQCWPVVKPNSVVNQKEEDGSTTPIMSGWVLYLSATKPATMAQVCYVKGSPTDSSKPFFLFD